MGHATLGAKSGTITVTSTSQGVQNGTINIPISFTVVLPGDYNDNNVVDAADYAVWRATLGQSVPTAQAPTAAAMAQWGRKT